MIFAVVLAIHLIRMCCSVNDLDAPWYFSQAASMAHGDLYFNSYTQSTSLLWYGIVQLPFYYILSAKLMVPGLYFTISVVVGYILLFRMGFKGSAALIALLLLSDRSFLTQRPEAFSVMFALLTYLVIRKASSEQKKLLTLGIATIILLLIHPANGVLFALAMLVVIGPFTVNRKVLIYIILIGALLGALTLFSMSEVYIETLAGRVSSFGPQRVTTFLIYSGITLVALLVIARPALSTYRTLGLVLLFIACSLFGGSYYYLFLMIPSIIMVSERLPVERIGVIPLVALAFNLLANLIHPYYTHIENNEYCDQVAAIESHLNSMDDGTIHIEPYFVTNLFSHQANARMLLYEDDEMKCMTQLTKGDLIIVTHSARNSATQKMITNASFEMDQECIIEAKPGLLTLASGYKQRTDSLGLWVYSIR